MRRAIKIALALTITCLILLPARSHAQQDALYTQYMDNLQLINPAYAGSQPSGNLSLVSRNQWVSFPNAPKTLSMAFHSPTQGGKVGLGFSVLNDKIGPQKQVGVYADYAYFVNLSNGFRMGLGLKGGVSFYRAALTELNTIEPDPIFSQDINKNFLPNLGVGLFIHSDDTWFGISVPKLVENTINRADYTTQYVRKEKIHFYGIAGRNFQLSEDFQLKTSTMLRIVRNAPLSVDLTALAGFRERFYVGGIFRFGDAVGLLTQFRATPSMLLGYSYDLTFSELNAFNSGTHEVMVSFLLNLQSAAN